MGFTTPSYGLDDLFARIVRGDIQLPDFQRNYVWDEDHIRSLLVTVLRGYPIGALMALDTRNEPMRFRPRPLAGAPDTGRSPGLLILDGQQRLTSLYHAFSPDGWVETLNFRGEAVRRAFFIDVAAAVSEDIVPDEAIFAVDEQGQVTSHFGPDIVGNLLDEDVHIGHQCLPIAGMLSDDGTRKLFQLSAAEARDGEDISSIVADFHSRVFFPLAGYDVPMIRLARETARAGIGSIFAQANAAGVHMDVFDLLTAVFSLEDENFHLANDWARVEKHLRKYPALDGIGRTQFLSAVSLYSTVNKGHAGGQREDILTLTLPEYQASVEKLRITFQEVAEFLKQRCIYTVEQVPYSAQIIPLAIILARLTDVPGALSAKQAWEKLDRWFWSGIFGELYGADSVKLRSARDVVEVVDWVLGDRSEEPKTVGEAVFYESRLHSAPDDSALLNAVYALLMSQGAKDWRTAQSFNQQSFKALGTGFHFIFPPAWCKRHQVSSDAAQSVVNRTPMGKKTEVLIEDSSPRRYLTRVQSKSLMEDTDFDVTLASHQLDPELLWKADFAAFTADRSRRLAAMIEQAMGKKVEPISKK